MGHNARMPWRGDVANSCTTIRAARGAIVNPVTGVTVDISEWLLPVHKSSTDHSGRLLAQHVICFHRCHGRNNAIMWSFLQL